MAQKKTNVEPSTGRVVLILDGVAQDNSSQKTG